MNNKEFMNESDRLKKMIDVIQDLSEGYKKEKAEIDEETEELYELYREGEKEVYDSLSVNLSIQKQLNKALENNEIILKKPYFGRIDYKDLDENIPQSFYIGKHGLTKGASEILIADWRAPVSTVYYDCNLGRGSYTSIQDTSIPIELNLKRTFDISGMKLLAYYDSAAVTDDDLLIKYLSQNKEAVLGDIITTIQQEQNKIIREKPFRNIIVQGAAGSGKTTVAIHRISYLLYNFNDRLKSKEICILGSSKILLDYITSGLPELDVYDTKQLQMKELFEILLDEDIDEKKCSIIKEKNINVETVKSTLSFIKKLENYMDEYDYKIIPQERVEDEYGCYLSKEHIAEFMKFNKTIPLTEKVELLEERLLERLPLILRDEKKEFVRKQKTKYRKIYLRNMPLKSSLQVYQEFIDEKCNTAVDEDMINEWIANIAKQKLDIYDLAALSYIKFRLSGIDQLYMIKQIFVDEAQDFGVCIYYILKEIFYNARFTIMGDVSQNILYDTGLNDWEELKNKVFYEDNSVFYTLLKSYRNTIEISEYAGYILKKSSFETYPVEPIIRHGRPVEISKAENLRELAEQVKETINHLVTKEYETIAIICNDIQEASHAQEILNPYINITSTNYEEFQFQKGIQILPIDLVKGLEFDAVILWDVNSDKYTVSNKNIKRLYVAVTRALHELYIYYTKELCPLLGKFNRTC